MNLDKNVRLSRLVSYVTMVGLLSTICGGIFVPSPARAQGAAPMQVGVIEFRNDSGVQGNVLARYATDAVVIEMSKSNRFDVITRSQIEGQMKELGLSYPLSATELSRLGEALAAEAMIEGSVKSVEIRGEGANRRAAATIVVRMVDQSSGEAINGAVQTGYSQARVGAAPDDDKLITEAINNAAYLTVKTMVDYIIPEATVLATIRTNEVLLNRGARDGVQSGMRMVVTRDKEIIGRVEIKEVEPDSSNANIIEARRGIKPEDKCRAVFDMPVVEKVDARSSTPSGAPRSGGKVRKSLTSVWKFLVPLAALAWLAGNFQSKGEKVGGIVAEAGSGNQIPIGGAAGVRVSWDTNRLAKGKNVVEYHVWRDNIPTPMLSANPSFGQAYDSPAVLTNAYQTADAVTNELKTGTTTVPALTLGIPHVYYVSALYLVNSVAGATYFETERVRAGQATPMAQIVADNLVNPVRGSDQNLHSVLFEWRSVKGADQYIVEVSDSPSFTNPKFVSDTVPFSPAADGASVKLTVSEALFNTFSNLSTTADLYWRVGMRSSTDSPGPIPPAGRSSFRYIYSETSQFRAIELPPGTP